MTVTTDGLEGERSSNDVTHSPAIQQQQEQQQQQPQVTPKLADIGSWLRSIPRDLSRVLEETPEYAIFLDAFEGLEQAHRRNLSTALSSPHHTPQSQPTQQIPQSQHGSCLRRPPQNSNSSQISHGNSSHSHSSSIHRQPPSIEHPLSSSSHRLWGHSHTHTHPWHLSSSSPPYSASYSASYSSSSSSSPSYSYSYSFLQQLAVDDVLLRVFEFLECASLVRTSGTCHRFRGLAHRSAVQRTQTLEVSLFSTMKYLRIQEQLEGTLDDTNPIGNGNFRVKPLAIPILGLSKRIRVQHAGDDEYNGVYFCTHTNANGYVFSKPRRRHHHSHSHSHSHGHNHKPTKLLRCLISKKFSNETILWYMSKEHSSVVEDEETVPAHVTLQQQQQQRNHQQQQQQQQQQQPQHEVFSFWANLTPLNDTTPDTCGYPSQTSVMIRSNRPAWQSFHRNQPPPIVELMD